jgi:hypothetical protein
LFNQLACSPKHLRIVGRHETSCPNEAEKANLAAGALADVVADIPVPLALDHHRIGDGRKFLWYPRLVFDFSLPTDSMRCSANSPGGSVAYATQFV